MEWFAIVRAAPGGTCKGPLFSSIQRFSVLVRRIRVSHYPPSLRSRTGYGYPVLCLALPCLAPPRRSSCSVLSSRLRKTLIRDRLVTIPCSHCVGRWGCLRCLGRFTILLDIDRHVCMGPYVDSSIAPSSQKSEQLRPVLPHILHMEHLRACRLLLL